jgi:hypothetical protein
MLLLDRGADVNIEDEEGYTPIDFTDEQTKDFITGYIYYNIKEPDHT